MKQTRYGMELRVREIEQILSDSPNMWHGAKAGYKAERTRLIKILLKRGLVK